MHEPEMLGGRSRRLTYSCSAASGGSLKGTLTLEMRFGGRRRAVGLTARVAMHQ